MSRLAAATAMLLLVAACGGDDEAATTTAPPPTSTTAQAVTTTAAATPEATTTTTQQDAETSTTTATSSTTSTTTTLAPSQAALAMTRIVFEPSSYVVITNVGGQPAELGDHWLCVFPAYQQLPAQALGPGESVAIALDAETPPDLVDFVAVIELGPVLGVPSAVDGELALYSSPDFGSATGILDYVQWGSGDHTRSAVAVDAGIWSPGAFLDVPEEALAISSSGAVGANEGDWFVDIGG